MYERNTFVDNWPMLHHEGDWFGALFDGLVLHTIERC
jgi:hypothetical protein